MSTAMAGQVYPNLQQIVARAAYDRRFCQQLFNGNRDTFIADLNLTMEEQAVLLAIEVDSLDALAAQLLVLQGSEEIQAAERETGYMTQGRNTN